MVWAKLSKTTHLLMIVISGGLAKGRKIKTLRGMSTRPLLSRIRKSLFDVLRENVVNSRFLDLYAGSGAVGIEALSRLAGQATFVEKNPACLEIIRENLDRCHLLDKAVILRGDVLTSFPHLLNKEKYDIIFIGPPYFRGLQERTLEIIEEKQARCFTVIVQHSSHESVSFEGTSYFQAWKEKKYGNTILTFLQSKR